MDRRLRRAARLRPRQRLLALAALQAERHWHPYARLVARRESRQAAGHPAQKLQVRRFPRRQERIVRPRLYYQPYAAYAPKVAEFPKRLIQKHVATKRTR